MYGASYQYTGLHAPAAAVCTFSRRLCVRSCDYIREGNTNGDSETKVSVSGVSCTVLSKTDWKSVAKSPDNVRLTTRYG